MECPDCRRTMSLGFSEYVCEWCTSKLEELRFHEGYVAMDDARLFTPHYVFLMQEEARQWAHAEGMDERKVVKVLSPNRFRWMKSRGKIPGLVIADRLYCIAPDHRFDPVESQVIIAPPGYIRPPLPKRKPEEDTRSEGDRLMDFFRK